jgi:hypothetical protein
MIKKIQRLAFALIAIPVACGFISGMAALVHIAMTAPLPFNLLGIGTLMILTGLFMLFAILEID